MPYLELSLTVRHAEQERVELALEDAGALAVTLLDAEADTPNERAILEPGVGETPLWGEIELTALFDIDVDRSGLLHVLAELLPELEPSRIRFREVADQDWTRAWMEDFRPMRFGRRLWIYPSNIEPPEDDPEAVVVRLDPGLAFGTGTHPTTALCLEWLDGLELAGKHVTDFGCGSGVLAIAALKLGAARVDGIDNEKVGKAWLARHIQQGHGPLGAAYPDVAFGMEGDTPAFLGLIPNGLNSPEHPDWGGWGGRYERYVPRREDTDPAGFNGGVPIEPETRPIWTNATDRVQPLSSFPGGAVKFTSNTATIWRWRARA